MHTEAVNHDPGVTMMNTGSQQLGKPSMGAWLSYGLGSESQNLPAFVVMISQGSGARVSQPIFARLWGAGFLPAKQHGTPMQTAADKPPLADLFAPDEFKDHPRDDQLLTLLNRHHAAGRHS